MLMAPLVALLEALLLASMGDSWVPIQADEPALD